MLDAIRIHVCLRVCLAPPWEKRSGRRSTIHEGEGRMLLEPIDKLLRARFRRVYVATEGACPGGMQCRSPSKGKTRPETTESKKMQAINPAATSASRRSP